MRSHPKGTDLASNLYIDRALAAPGARASGLYMQGPWKRGRAPIQEYHLPLTPGAALSAGIDATNSLAQAYGKTFDWIEDAQRQEGWSAGPPARSPSTSGAGRCVCSGRRFTPTVIEGM